MDYSDVTSYWYVDIYESNKSRPVLSQHILIFFDECLTLQKATAMHQTSNLP